MKDTKVMITTTDIAAQIRALIEDWDKAILGDLRRKYGLVECPECKFSMLQVKREEAGASYYECQHCGEEFKWLPGNEMEQLD